METALCGLLPPPPPPAPALVSTLLVNSLHLPLPYESQECSSRQKFTSPLSSNTAWKSCRGVFIDATSLQVPPPPPADGTKISVEFRTPPRAMLRPPMAKAEPFFRATPWKSHLADCRSPAKRLGWGGVGWVG
jgi:hypothetical protein